MKLLSKDMQDTIAKQMSLKARDIDVCLYNILDNSLPKEFILDCLSFYQNKDGGFGNALYIDNYNPNSSVYQVYEAFRLLDICEFDSNSKEELYDIIINKAGNYLYNRNTLINNKWNLNTESNNNYAHSELFEYNDKNFNLFGLHPSMAIVGYSLKFFKETKAYYKKAYNLAIKLIDEYLNKNEVSKYDLISVDSFINSAKHLGLFKDELKKVEDKLKKDVIKLIDENKIDPLDIIYLDYDKLNTIRDKALDDLIDDIKDFGLWDYKKSWGNMKYAEEDSAMIKWIGANSANNYYILKHFERIE